MARGELYLYLECLCTITTESLLKHGSIIHFQNGLLVATYTQMSYSLLLGLHMGGVSKSLKKLDPSVLSFGVQVWVLIAFLQV